MAKMRLNATTSKLRNIYAMADFMLYAYLFGKKPFTKEVSDKVAYAWRILADAYEQHTGEKRDEYLNRSVPTAIKLLDTTPPSDGLH